MVKLLALWAATLLLAAGAVAEELLGIAYFDVQLNEEGRVTQAVCVDQTPPVLIDPLRNWLSDKTFTQATTGDRPVLSTTSIWLTYALVETEHGYELAVRNYDSGPRPTRRVNPDYPTKLAMAGKEGSVRFRLTIDPSGKVSDATVLESSDVAFSRTAMRAIKEWRFAPDTADGRAISSEVEQTIVFTLAR